jgi:hypothetical protein
MRPFLFLVLELAVVHQTRDRGSGSWRDLHQVNVLLFSQTESFGKANDTYRLVVDATQAQFGRIDFAINAMRLVSSYCSFL